jgi:hypothetical protein
VSAGQGAHYLTGKIVLIIFHVEFVRQQTATMEQGSYVVLTKVKGRKHWEVSSAKKNPHLSPRRKDKWRFFQRCGRNTDEISPSRRKPKLNPKITHGLPAQLAAQLAAQPAAQRSDEVSCDHSKRFRHGPTSQPFLSGHPAKKRVQTVLQTREISSLHELHDRLRRIKRIPKPFK